MNIQYKKGVLELCVLALLHKRDCYGYEISESSLPAHRDRRTERYIRSCGS